MPRHTGKEALRKSRIVTRTTPTKKSAARVVSRSTPNKRVVRRKKR